MDIFQLIETYAKFLCVSRGKTPDEIHHDALQLEERCADDALSSPPPSPPLIFESTAGASAALHRGVNVLRLETAAPSPGCFILDALVVRLAERANFEINYKREMTREQQQSQPHRLQNVLCLVDIKRPSIVLKQSNGRPKGTDK